MATAATTTKKNWFAKRLTSNKSWRWRIMSSGFRWKRLNFKLSFFHDVLFRIVSFFEAIFLVSTLCLFYCFCGCHF